MIKTPPNKIFQNQNNRLMPATFKKAIITSVNVARNSANVYIVGNAQTIIKNIPLSSAIIASTVKLGSKCRVDCFDESNPSDQVVAYVY